MVVRMYRDVTEEISCTRCCGSDCIKDGLVRQKQRYFCKNCRHRFTLFGRKTDKSLKRKALILYIEGFGVRPIGRMLNVSHVSVQNWVKECGDEFKALRNKNKPEFIKSQELVNYIGTEKNKHLEMLSGWLLIGIGKDLMLTFWLEDMK